MARSSVLLLFMIKLGYRLYDALRSQHLNGALGQGAAHLNFLILCCMV